jgi:hypothetical protein
MLALLSTGVYGLLGAALLISELHTIRDHGHAFTGAGRKARPDLAGLFPRRRESVTISPETSPDSPRCGRGRASTRQAGGSRLANPPAAETKGPSPTRRQ